MTVILDANVLLRLTDTTAAQHPVAVAALATLHAQGNALYTFPQSIYEFWVVATRPLAANGLDLPPAECDQTLDDITAAFPVLPDATGLVPEWRTLVTAHACRGKPAHDARYVAAMRTHGVTRLLTFNAADFARYPGVVALDPHALAA